MWSFPFLNCVAVNLRGCSPIWCFAALNNFKSGVFSELPLQQIMQTATIIAHQKERKLTLRLSL